MSIKNFVARQVEKITGKKCGTCRYSMGGRCAHPSDGMFMKCWHGITRPGWEERQEPAAGDMTQEEKHQLAMIVTSLQEASETARDGGLLGE